MKKTPSRLLVLLLSLSVAALPAVAKDLDEARQKIDAASAKALERLFKESPKAKELYGQSYGYATFGGAEIAILISSGGGSGVAVAKPTGERTYMKVVSAGVGIGFGAQSTQTVFLFEDKDTFTRFVHSGWDADASASAAAAQEGINAKSSFTNGMMVYQMTKKGLIAQASLKGTKYWKADALNEQ